MPDLWMPGATRKPASKDGGSMCGGSPRALIHTTENNPALTTASSVAAYLDNAGHQVHLIWNPVRAELVQMIPADRAGRGLKHPAGTPETNRAGTVCLQVEVVGRASEPFTDGPMRRWDEILAWFDSWGIPHVWPAGAPLPADQAYGDNGTRSQSAWEKGGYFAHSQVPNNDHADPGAIDITRLFDTEDDMTPEQADQLARIAAFVDSADAKILKAGANGNSWAADVLARLRRIDDLILRDAPGSKTPSWVAACLSQIRAKVGADK